MPLALLRSGQFSLFLAPALAAQSDWSLAHQLPTREQAQAAYDAARDRLVLFGGFRANQTSNETWELGSAGWSHRLPAVSPSPRYLAAMVYDAARRTVVLFGGAVPGGPSAPALGDMWLWDGDQWTQVSGITLPPPRSAGAIAYDATRQRVVLFGGFSATVRRDDTWEWDGTAWTQIATVATPPARDQAAMAFDRGRNRCVLYGGHLGGGVFPRDTWEYDGAAWTQVVAAPPTADYTMRLAFDPLRQRTVLHGGLRQTPATDLNETWEWDGVRWSQRAPIARPPVRRWSSLVWHEALQRCVLLGASSETDAWAYDGLTWARLGSDGAPILDAHAIVRDVATGLVTLFGARSGGGVENWVWLGGRWARRTSTNVPNQVGFEVAADLARQRVVAFGGFVGNTPSADTWEWDGSDWQRVQPLAAPAVRTGHALAFDPVNARVLLFGGNLAPSGPAPVAGSDTWGYDGTTWSQLQPTTRPAARFAHAMATDPLRRRVVLFGGATANSVFGDTWEWDGATWSLVASGGPSARAGASLHFDSVRQRVVLFGAPANAQSTTANETWEWDGSTWTQLVPPVAPVARSQTSVEFDAASGSTVAYGGVICQGSCAAAYETLLLGRTAAPAAQLFGTGCAGTLGVPVIGGDEPYVPHAAFALELRRVLPNSVGALGLASAQAPVSLGGGCTLYLAGAVELFAVLANGSGVARLPVPIPGVTSLIGATLFTQGATLDPQGPVGGLALSAARRLTIGD